jgi:hypothetical protein
MLRSQIKGEGVKRRTRERIKDVHKQERKQNGRKEIRKKHHKTADYKATTQKDSEITKSKKGHRLHKHPSSNAPIR